MLVAAAVTMRVADVAVVHDVVDAGDGDGLRRRSSWPAVKVRLAARRVPSVGVGAAQTRW